MDIAIIVAEYQDIYELPVAMLYEDDVVYMCGFPQVLQDSKYVNRFCLEGKVKISNREELITTISDAIGTFDNSEIDTLKCYSGAGIFSSFGKGLVLAGIETEALTKDVAFHSVRNIPISYIEELINAHIADGFKQQPDVFEHRDITMQLKNATSYPRILVPITEMSQNQSVEEMRNQYFAGINAHPDHIRKNFDIRRPYWIEQLSKHFCRYNVVIVKGASGQGKSTLAYRFLMDRYSEEQILCVKKILNESDIETAMMSLREIRSEKEIVFFYDVQPGDMFWAKFVEDFIKHGQNLQRCKLLIAIRQEDYNRTHFDRSSFMVSEIDLKFSKKEAMGIYDRYKSTNYLSFEDSWVRFGENGPLMEYIFMLNNSVTLVERIRGQIGGIEDTDDADEWIGILEAIALAGKHNHRLNLSRLFTVLPCRNRNKLLERFKKELFIKVSSEGNYIECLHVVRAEILFRVLRERFLFDYERVLFSTLALIEDNPVYMLIEYFREYSCTDKLVERIANIEVANIEVIQGILKSLLWYEVFDYQNTNKDIIEKGDKLLNNQFIMLGLSDITGYLTGDGKQQPLSGVFQVLDKLKPGIKRKIEDLYREMSLKQLKYRYVDLYLSKLQSVLKPQYLNTTWSNISAIGYVLFWQACRGCPVTLDFLPEMEYSVEFSSEECLDLMKGLNYQRQNGIYQSYKDKVFNYVLDDCGVAFYWKEDNEIFAHIICDPCAEDNIQFNEACMQAVWALRIFEPDMKKYNVWLLGAELEGIFVPDTYKSISSENLYEEWIRELNRINLYTHEYSVAPENWKIVCDQVIKKRNAIVTDLSTFLKVINKWYRKNSLDRKAIQKLLKNREEGNPFVIPQCARDEYGIIHEKLYANEDGKKHEELYANEDGNFDLDKEKSIEKLSQRFFSGIDNFFRMIPDLLVEVENKKNDFNQRRLAFYNIKDAYEALLSYQKVFDVFFNDYTYKIDLREELLTVLQSACVTRQMYQERFRIESNIVYNSTEIIKKEFRNIDSFIETGIADIKGVSNVENQNCKIVVTVLFEFIDTFLSHLFCLVKTLVGERGRISISEAYFKNKVSSFVILYTLNGNTIMRTEIPVRNILISEDLDKFKLLCRYGSVIINPEEGSLQEKVYFLLLEVQNEIKGINEQVFQINNSLEHTRMVMTNDIALNRINESYQKILKNVSEKLTEVLTLLEENHYEERTLTVLLNEIIGELSSHKSFILSSVEEAQELHNRMESCVQILYSLLKV